MNSRFTLQSYPEPYVSHEITYSFTINSLDYWRYPKYIRDHIKNNFVGNINIPFFHETQIEISMGAEATKELDRMIGYFNAHNNELIGHS